MGTYPVTDLAEYLRGAWHLARDIVDADGAALGTFTGTAEFTPQDDELHYHEQGELRLAEHQGRASRSLRYHPEEPARCTVWFADGHFFHDLRLDTGTWEVRHPCRADLYYGYFEVTGNDQWQQHWRVAGPEKAYEMTTTFTRPTTAGRR